VITLCEWHVVVDVPDDFVESEADTLSAAVMTSLAERAVETELRFSTSGRRFGFTPSRDAPGTRQRPIRARPS